MGPRGNFQWREPKKVKKGAKKPEKAVLPVAPQAPPVEVIPKGKKRKVGEEEE